MQQDQGQQESDITAGGSVDMSAGNDLTLVSSRGNAGREAYLVAGNDINLLAAQNYDYSLYQKKKKGSFGKKSFKRDEVTEVTNVGSEIATGGDLVLASGSDQTYQAAKLDSGGDIALLSGGDIAFEGVKDLKQESHEKSKSSWAWQSMKGQGTTDEALVQSQVEAVGELAIRAAGNIRIDIKEVNAQTIGQTIDAMVAAEPGLAWLKEMEQRGDVDWHQVKEIHDSFKYSHSGLGGVAAVVIAIVVAYFTAGAASGAIGAGAEAGSAMAAAVPATATTSAAAAGWANAALSAVAGAAASTATISAINNKGDLGAVLKDVTSEDALKGYLASAGIAGLAAYTDMWGRSVTEDGNTLLTDLPERTKAYAFNTIAKGVLTGADSGEEWSTVAGLGLAGELYQYWVGSEADARPGVDRPDGPEFKPISEDGFYRVPQVVVDGVVRMGKNIGHNEACTSIVAICHGTSISNALNVVPGFNSFATLHDTWMNWFDKNAASNIVTNIGTMPPAALINYGSLVNQYYWLKPVFNEMKGK